VLEFGELAVEIKSGHELEHSCGHQDHEAGDGLKAKGMGGVRVHGKRNTVVEEGD
jgi:hypothetical protein